MLFGIDSLYFWLAVIIISIAAEAATLGLCGIWFAAGGAAALVAATFGASIWMQLAETGAVRVLGKEWTARTKDGTPVPAGARVTILEIRGVKAIVQKIETNGEKE